MTALSMTAAYQKALALAEHYQQPAFVVSATRFGRYPAEVFDAMTEDDYRHASPRPEYFDAVEPKED
jgi:hypothetical protein